MKVIDILKKNSFSASFEFFPPKSQQASETLYQNIKDLLPLTPSYVSVTYGAGGSTQKLTKDLVLKLQKETKLCIVSHLTCVGHTQEQIHQLLEDYTEAGIENLMVLRGDPPKGHSKFEPVPGGFSYANELLYYIKKHFPHFACGVAGYPEGHAETPNRLEEMDNLKRKVDAGADYICTQLFFDNRDFYDFGERCEIAGIQTPIIAGIMPVNSRAGIRRMADLAKGARFPAALLRAVERAKDDEGVSRVGVHWATEQVRDLLDHKVKGIHFYTLNQSHATLEIYRSLGLHSG